MSDIFNIILYEVDLQVNAVIFLVYGVNRKIDDAV